MRSIASFFLFTLFFIPFAPFAASQSSTAADTSRSADLQLVVMLSRHGVRSPLGVPGEYDKYSAAPWPKWDVPPGTQTAHGDRLIRIFGAWDRKKFAGLHLFAPTGCADAAHVTIVADNDQRTRATGSDLAEGMFPGCRIAVRSLPDGVKDPLFQPTRSGAVHSDPALTSAAILGRMGGNPDNLAAAYHSQLALLDHVLAGCGRVPANPKRTSLLDLPAPVRYPAATLAENLLLEYTEGMSQANTGWGCLDGATLRTIMQIDTAAWDFGFRTPAVARPYASPILDRILMTMQQSATGAAVPGALGKPADRLVILAGHDTNIVTVSGALRIDWVLDGRFDDPAPGGALLFELWRPRDGGKPFVRVEYTVQTLEQMRNAEPLTSANPPAMAPIFVPGCSRADLSCTWEDFAAAMRQAIDPTYAAATAAGR
jgi:4-phytase/acid phosphatase